MDKTYTFVLDWEGGAYLSQFTSATLDQAIRSWAASIDMTVIGASTESKEKFLASIEYENPVKITGLTSVWCISPSIDGRIGFLHIVRTDI